MVVAVEIERNKLEYQAEPTPSDEAYEEIIESDNEIAKVNHQVYMDNMNDTIDTAIDKLWNNKKLTEEELLALDLWVC